MNKVYLAALFDERGTIRILRSKHILRVTLSFPCAEDRRIVYPRWGGHWNYRTHTWTVCGIMAHKFLGVIHNHVRQKKRQVEYACEVYRQRQAKAKGYAEYIRQSVEGMPSAGCVLGA